MDKINLFDGSYLCYDVGKFDNWCVYEIDKNGIRKAPKDIEYFTDLYEYAKIFDNDEIYEDFVEVYNMTTNYLEDNVVEKIKKISMKYGKFHDKIFRVLAILYMAMISEEHKRNTKLGKRIKRLGVYFLLIKEKTPKYCANFMKGKKYTEIEKLCIEGGF